jgi:hypothetical protein
MYFTHKNIMLPTHYDFFYHLYHIKDDLYKLYIKKNIEYLFLTLKTFHMTFDKK